MNRGLDLARQIVEQEFAFLKEVEMSVSRSALAAYYLSEADSEIEALRKDAERYRFLRDNPGFQIEFTGELTLDEHVDAAMAQSEHLTPTA